MWLRKSITWVSKVDRIVFLTEEVTQQLKSWLDYKYRTRRVCYQEKQNGKVITEYRTPHKTNIDLVFAVYQDKERPNAGYLYDEQNERWRYSTAIRPTFSYIYKITRTWEKASNLIFEDKKEECIMQVAK